ncbi:hypothetical protein K466DRAFT_479298 [Polyporus arcularius HHB13444]|uniref:Uncharacterized protein n=1 Tax=Polyporus arcularius HHB13444 TaxID=1314778 RepID=A0A5C3PZ02_9APHY|nr:hypothetical protein K466DRAFT_479298 [Polyporus arcularius HHB13444]
MGPPQPQAAYTPPGHPSYAPQGSTPHGQQQQYGSPQGQPPQGQQQQYFTQPQGVGSVGGIGGIGGVGGVGSPSAYPPGGQTPMMGMSAGQQYQQQLFAMCAAGNHDVTTKYGIAGIITAIVCFPCGLICLFADTEKRCVRCGSRVG